MYIVILKTLFKHKYNVSLSWVTPDKHQPAYVTMIAADA